eukprot:GFUD01017645.1.p1 GENE.GFUD01017645.1~~GFUD01017645.1.p1  ORF type:complete len:280 (-),score=49.15 GFUD01017645.1:127-966(-)
MAYQNIQTIDLAMVRENSPNPTCDIKFTFLDQATGLTSELPAHKLILAFGSEVFMRQFFGTLPEEKDTIPIEDSSVQVFRIFLDIIYNKKISLEAFDFQLLADLYYLAEKYHHELLKDSIAKEVSARKIVSGNLLEVAKLAETNSHLAQFSSSLFNICYVFLRGSDQGTIFDIFENEDVGEENSSTLHRLMAGAKRSRPNPSDICKNCQQELCLNGKKLTKCNFVTGASVSREGVELEKGTRKTLKMDECGGVEYSVVWAQGRGGNFNAKFSELTYICT